MICCFQVLLCVMKQLSAFGFKWSRGEWIFTFFLLTFACLFVFVEMNNGKLYTNDFRVYYNASRDFFSGNSPYEHAYGLSTGFFKYPPFTLYLFGLISWLPYDAAKMVHLSLLLFATCYSFLTLRRIVNSYFSPEKPIVASGWLYLAFAVFAIHLTRELHMGNVNMILVALFVTGLHTFLNKKSGKTAVFWSLMIILKPILIVALIPILLTKSWNVVVRMLVLGMVYLIIPLFHLGINGAWKVWVNWFKAAAAHGDYLTSNNTIANILRAITGFEQGWIVTALLFLLLVFLMVKEQLKSGNSGLFMFKWGAVFLAFIPNIFITDTEHFLYAMPLVFLIFYVALTTKEATIWGFFAVGMLCFSFHSSDLLGKNLSDWVSIYGLLGIGNLIFIGTCLTTKIPLKMET